MSFAEDIADSTKTKIVLAELDIPLIFTDWINYQAGVWFTKLLDANQSIEDDSGVVGYYYANVSEVPNKIGSCLVDTEFYTKVDSIAECVALEKSFYHNESTSEVYIRFEDWKPYISQIIRLGSVNGFTNIVNSNGAYYDGIYYEPSILSLPTITQKKDPLFYGVQNFISGDITFINDEGKFDNYGNLNIYGQPVRLLLGVLGYEYDDFEQIAEGFVESYPRTSNAFTIKFQDKRKNLSRKIPYNQFDQTEFPYLHDDDVGKYKPLAWGRVYYMPCICINATESSPTNRTFKFLDTEFERASSDNYVPYMTAYIKNDEDNNIYDQVAIADVDIYNGTFDILRTKVDNDSDEPRDVFFSGWGFHVDSGAQFLDSSINVLESLINLYSNITYSSTFFDITEIDSEISSPRYVGYYVSKPEEIIKIIGKIAECEDAIFYTKPDGRFSLKQFDEDRVSSQTLKAYNWENEASFDPSAGGFLTSSTVEGKLHIAKKEYLNVKTNTDYEQDGLYKYKKYESKSFETILYTDSNIEDKNQNIMIQAKDIVDIAKRTCDMSAYSISLMDFITASHTRQSEEEDFKVWEVIQHNLDLTNWKINLEMKYQREV
ncbi:MAG: hypothetical protein GY870_21945 [archaeon]|nr:hypothetical protein [archaeon]